MNLYGSYLSCKSRSVPYVPAEFLLTHLATTTPRPAAGGRWLAACGIYLGLTAYSSMLKAQFSLPRRHRKRIKHFSYCLLIDWFVCVLHALFEALQCAEPSIAGYI